MINRRNFIALSGAALAACGYPPTPRAQSSLPLARLMVGFPAGGSLDVVARLLVEHMKGYAETTIVENRAGAGGRIALEALKHAPADGSQFVLTPGDQLSLFPNIYSGLRYDPLQDFAAVGTVCTVQFVLTVGPQVPTSVDTLAAFIAWCRDNPKIANYGTAGAGTRQHLMGARLARSAGFEFVHVPYKGAPPALQDVIAGSIAANIAVISSALPSIRSGHLRALMTSASTRSAQLPNVPTAREAGFSDLEAVETFGVLLPAGTPQGTIDALNAGLRSALDSAAVRNGLERLSFEVRGSSPQEHTDLIKSDLAAWADVVRGLGFKPIN